MLDNNYDVATNNMELANRIDSHCLQLPKVGPSDPDSGDNPPSLLN